LPQAAGEKPYLVCYRYDKNLGLCGEGEAGRMIDKGRTSTGGDMLVNGSGGLLSKGHPLGATGVANTFETVTHSRGWQVEGAKVGLAYITGLGSASAHFAS
jgi:acetyl-CoA acetyltransferase